MKHSRIRQAIFLLALAAASSAFAQLPVARLSNLFPPGGRAGSSVDVGVSGQDLDGTTELRFSDPGITASKAGDADSQTEHKFSVKVGKDVAPGVYEARVVGRFGVSNPRAFAVGDRPEADVTPRHEAADAPVLPLGSVASGRCTAGAADFYAIELKKGQRVLVECATREIDARTALVMVLTDPAGHEVERSRRGGLLDYTPAEDGRYTVEVHDLVYRAGPEYFYRLSAGTGPHLDSVFPPVGEPGSKGKYTLLGRNLPGGSRSSFKSVDGKALDQLEVEIELPADAETRPQQQAEALLGTGGAAVTGIAYRLKSDQGSSNPLLVGFARAPVVAEAEGNDKPGAAQKVPVPCEFVGRFYPHGDTDWLTFDAKAGESYWVEVLSERLGQPTSPLVVVQKLGQKKPKEGKEDQNDKSDPPATDVKEMSGSDVNAGGTSFRTATRDDGFRLEAKEDATYRVMVRDLFDSAQDNPALVYRLSIRKAAPDFRLVALPLPTAGTQGGNGQINEAAVATPLLRKGGVTAVRVVLFRLDGFAGPVKLEAEGLPPGVTCTPTTVGPNDSAGVLLLTAGDGAADWSGNVRVVGKATVGDAERSHDARPATVVWGALPGNQNGEAAQSRLAGEFALAVRANQDEPLTIERRRQAVRRPVRREGEDPREGHPPGRGQRPAEGEARRPVQRRQGNHDRQGRRHAGTGPAQGQIPPRHLHLLPPDPGPGEIHRRPRPVRRKGEEVRRRGRQGPEGPGR